MVAAGQSALRALLPRDIHKAIWRRLANRLVHGEVLLTTGDYMRVLEAEYAALTGAPATPDVVDVLRQAIETYNHRHPEACLARGVVNCVTKAFSTGARRPAWDQIKIASAGPPSIVRFARRERVRSFLEGVRVPTERINPRECIHAALAAASPRSTPPTGDTPSPVILSDDVRLALRSGMLDQDQINGRLATQRRRRAALRDAEVRKVARRVEVLVELGRLSPEDGRTLRELRQLDREVAPEVADHAPTGLELLPPAEQSLLNAKMRGAIEFEVGYLDIFASLQRIATEYDEALVFLAGREPDGSCEEIAAELAADGKITEHLNMLADRVDDEVRMLAVGLPPYDNPELSRGARSEPDEAVSFVERFREFGLDEISDQLCSADRDERARPVAAMNRLVSVLRQLAKPTPLRLEVRALKVRQKVDDLFRSGGEPKALRQKAQSIFSMRMRRMFPDLAAEEQSAIESRAVEIVGGVEAALAEERRMRRIAASESAGSPSETEVEDPTAAEGPTAADGSLTPEETRQGALIGRVETRIAGEIRPIPQVIMVDPDHPDHFVVGQRDESGRLVPALRNGSRSRVRKARDGSWRVVS